MNYRHAFHAGNFADLIKHAVLTHLLDALTAGLGALTVIDTHAGAGIYDLAGEEARRTGEG
ncbi:MAG TPA: 23S rRNA (adenine(2030)-N(6))-methyltransferase RlmJ, partial [Caulobacteraceae bacterium]|nr:23S rRNA (adenine(2030)-N(6))-methyltransferase RlmJ [Caulobacteraceae bacterium]